MLLLDRVERTADAHRADPGPVVASRVRPAFEAVEDPRVLAVHHQHAGRPARLAHGDGGDPQSLARRVCTDRTLLAGAKMTERHDPAGDVGAADRTPPAMII